MAKIVTVVSCWFLALVLVFAGVDKLFHYEGFTKVLAQILFLPDAIAENLAFAVILLEIGAGIGLLRSQWRRSAALCGAVLLSGFTAGLAITYWTGAISTCGSWFTLTLSRSTGQHIIQNLLLIALALSIFFTDSREESDVVDEELGTATT